MPVEINLRLPETIHERLEEIAEESGRSKSFLIRKAIERYLEIHADNRIALDRLHDKDDEIISSKELRKRLASKD
jgi:RHH-type rel operon transcriptional repressor/antitoxin RelB